MLMNPPPFPADLARSYPPIKDEPEFRADKHLALEAGGQRVNLDSLHYDPDEIQGLPSTLAVGGPFRLLSHTGVEAMRFIARSFKQLGPRTEGDPKAAYLKPRGLLYSSRFVRDLCTAPVLNAFLSEIAATPLALHGMPTAAAAVIYAPPEIEKTNQGWHLDTVGFACVIALNDPHELEGGSFQFFKGTRQSVAEWLGVETQDLRKSVGHLTSLPTEQVVTARFPAAGYAMLMQGQMVLHRGEPLRSPGERMMLVSSFMSLDPRFPDATHWPEIRRWNSPALEEEYRRHTEWRKQSHI